MAQAAVTPAPRVWRIRYKSYTSSKILVGAVSVFHTPNRPCLAGALLCLVMLGACAQDTSNSPSAKSQSVAALPAIRVIIQFQRGTPLDQAAFVSMLRVRTQATGVYMASVSNDTHVFALSPPLGESYGQMLLKVADLPQVVNVEADQKASPAR